MSDNIPLEIQMEIIERIVDIKLVIQYRSVSKAWKSVIDSKEFVAGHTLRHIRLHHDHLLIRGQDFGDPQVKYVSILDKDDDTFPHQKCSVFVPESVKILCKDARIVGSSHGLFCLYDYEKNVVVIWNPSIRKTVVTVVPNVLSKLYRTVVGFGVCYNTLDPKLVKIAYVYDGMNIQNVNTGTQVEVFTLSSRAWRSPLSNTFPRKSIEFGGSQAVVDGFIYWNAIDRIKDVDDDDGFRKPNLIMSFDLTSEEFTEVYLPDYLALNPPVDLSVSNLRESLAVLEFNCFTERETCGVWIMKGHGCTRSFVNLYLINKRYASIRTTLGFRTSGAPIIEVGNWEKISAVAVYEPKSKDITEIWSDGIEGTFCVHSYIETLLLLGH